MSNSKSAGWERTRRSQVAIARTSVLFITILVVALLILLFRPIQNELRRRDLGEFEARATLVEADISSFIEQSKQLAAQLPSRTRIREELVAYLEGRRELESYLEFTGPKLRDAIDATPSIAAAYRLDLNGTPLIGAKMRREELPSLTLDPERVTLLSATRRIGGEPVIFFAAPIHAPDFGLAGYDLVAISLADLQTRLTKLSKRLEDITVVLSTHGNRLELPVTAGLPEAMELALNADPELLRMKKSDVTSFTKQLTINGEDHYGVFFPLPGTWQLSVSQLTEILYAPARKDTLLFAGIVFLVGVAAVIATAGMSRILSQRTLAERGELSRMVDERTSQLELLLRELHHRVKNDMNLIYSLLSLHAMQSRDERVAEALREAQGSVLLMSRIYDHLHRDARIGDANLRPFLTSLVADLRDSAPHADGSINASIEDVTVPKSIAVPLAIIVNELITNALKYAKREDQALEVGVQLGRSPEGGFDLVVRDNGPGFPDTVLRGERGFGLSMVETMAKQLESDLEITNTPQPMVRVKVPPASEPT